MWERLKARGPRSPMASVVATSRGRCKGEEMVQELIGKGAEGDHLRADAVEGALDAVDEVVQALCVDLVDVDRVLQGVLQLRHQLRLRLLRDLQCPISDSECREGEEG